MIEAAIFDVGKVLHSYDPKPIYEDIISTLKITPEDFNKNWNRLTIELEIGKLTEEEYWNQFKTNTGSSIILPTESLLVRKYHVGFTIFNDVIRTIKSLKDEGIRVAVLSNSIEPHYQYNKNAGLYDLFSVQVFSHQTGMRKPDPRIYQLTLDRLQTQPQNTIFIDDRDENVETAKNLGIIGILFTDPKKLSEDLNNLGILLS